MDGVQVWLGKHIVADPQNPAWQDLLVSHRSGSASTSDRDELGGPRLLRSRQRITLTTIIQLPPGRRPQPPVPTAQCSRHAFIRLSFVHTFIHRSTLRFTASWRPARRQHCRLEVVDWGA